MIPEALFAMGWRERDGRLWVLDNYSKAGSDIMPSVFKVGGRWYCNYECVESYEDIAKRHSTLKMMLSFDSPEEAAAYCTTLVAMSKNKFKRYTREEDT